MDERISLPHTLQCDRVTPVQARRRVLAEMLRPPVDASALQLVVRHFAAEDADFARRLDRARRALTNERAYVWWRQEGSEIVYDTHHACDVDADPYFASKTT